MDFTTEKGHKSVTPDPSDLQGFRVLEGPWGQGYFLSFLKGPVLQWDLCTPKKDGEGFNVPFPYLYVFLHLCITTPCVLLSSLPSCGSHHDSVSSTHESYDVSCINSVGVFSKFKSRVIFLTGRRVVEKIRLRTLERTPGPRT